MLLQGITNFRKCYSLYNFYSLPYSISPLFLFCLCGCSSNSNPRLCRKHWT